MNIALEKRCPTSSGKDCLKTKKPCPYLVAPDGFLFDFSAQPTCVLYNNDKMPEPEPTEPYQNRSAL